MNWYKKAQLEAAPQIEWTLPKTFDPETEAVINVNVQKLDNLWQKDPFYVSKKAGDAGVSGKYKYWEDRFLNKEFKNIEMPEIGIYSDPSLSGIIGFKEGRHRFCVARDFGITKIPVVIPKNQSFKIKELIG